MSETSSGPVPGLPVPASAIQPLTLVADHVVKANGGVAPAWVSAVVTTREKAFTSATPGDFVPEYEQTIVYLVTMKGQFVANRPRPPRAKAATGNYLSVVINAETLRTIDFGLHRKPPPVAPDSLGPVTYLKNPVTGQPH